MLLVWDKRVFEKVDRAIDHCPLLVVAGNVKRGRSAFKFENM